VALSLSAQIHYYVNKNKLQSKGVDKGAEADPVFEIHIHPILLYSVILCENPNRGGPIFGREGSRKYAHIPL